MSTARVSRAFAEALLTDTLATPAVRVTRTMAEVLVGELPTNACISRVFSEALLTDNSTVPVVRVSRVMAEALVYELLPPNTRVSRVFAEALIKNDIPDALAEITDNTNATLTIISRAGRTVSLALHHSIDTTFGYQTVKLDRWNESVAHAYCFRGYYGVYIFDGYIN